MDGEGVIKNVLLDVEAIFEMSGVVVMTTSGTGAINSATSTANSGNRIDRKVGIRIRAIGLRQRKVRYRNIMVRKIFLCLA